MTEAARSLATEQGLRDFQAILLAHDTWRAMTKAQRRLLLSGEGLARVRARLVEAQLIEADGTITGWGRFVIECSASLNLGKDGH